MKDTAKARDVGDGGQADLRLQNVDARPIGEIAFEVENLAREQRPELSLRCQHEGSDVANLDECPRLGVIFSSLKEADSRPIQHSLQVRVRSVLIVAADPRRRGAAA
jgi:hypothetical protein